MEHLNNCRNTTELAVELLQLIDLGNHTILPACRVLKGILGTNFTTTVNIVKEVHQAQINMDKYNHRLDDYLPYIVNLIESVTIDKLLSETL
jgi:hypothetical protein